MKNSKIILVLFFLATTSGVFAQKEVGHIDLSLRNPDGVYAVSDSNRGLAYIFKTNRQYQVTLLSNELGVDGKAIVNRNAADRREEHIGGMFTDSHFITWFYHKKLKSYSCLKVSRTGKDALYRKVIPTDGKEEFLKAFAMEGKFYILTIPQYNNAIKVISTADGENYDTHIYPVEMPAFYASLSKAQTGSSSQSGSAIGATEIKYLPENNIRTSYSRKKLYHIGNKIILTFDDPGTTHLVIIDPLEKETSYKRLNFTLDKGNNSNQKAGNSFIIDDHLFRLTLSPDQINISIVYLDSMELVNSYNIFPERDVEILNSPILQEGNTPHDERILKKTSQLFKKMLNGESAIAVNRIDEGRYELEIGAYEEYVVHRGGGGPRIAMGFGGFGGFGGLGMGSFYNPYGMPFYGSGMAGPGPRGSALRTRVTYFKSMLEGEYFTHRQGNIPKNLREKTEDYREGRFRSAPPELLRITPHQDALLLGFYSRRLNKFHLIEFRK